MFKDFMRAERVSQRIVLKQLSKCTGISLSRLSVIEDGREIPAEAKFEAIKEALAEDWDPLGEDKFMDEFLDGINKEKNLDKLYFALDQEAANLARPEIMSPIKRRIAKVEGVLMDIQPGADPVTTGYAI